MKPTAPGWYWYKFGKKPWSMIQVSEHQGRLYVIGLDGPLFWLDDGSNGWTERVNEWVGPLQPPA